MLKILFLLLCSVLYALSLNINTLILANNFYLKLDICSRVFSVQPKAYAAFVGSTVTLKCHSQSKPEWRKRYGKNNFVIKTDISHCKETKVYTYELYISEASTQHNGEYICQGTQLNGVPFKESSLVHIGGKYLITYVDIRYCKKLGMLNNLHLLLKSNTGLLVKTAVQVHPGQDLDDHYESKTFECLLPDSSCYIFSPCVRVNSSTFDFTFITDGHLCLWSEAFMLRTPFN